MLAMKLEPKDFFDLSTYSHKELFESKEFVWEALSALQEYMDKLLKRSMPSHKHEGVFFENPETIVIGKGVVIEPGAYLKGPCWIGDGSVIRHGAYIRGYVLTGRKCVIGHATEIKHSILLDDAHAAHFNYVGDSILGNHVNLGAGVKCANLRLDKQTISVRWEKQKFNTGLQKFGAVFGDHSQLGCNAVSNPGTLLLPNVVCAPCLSVGGVITTSKILKR